MTLKDDLRAYQARWNAVEAIQREERLSAPLELRWQQLNAAYGIAKGLGLLRPDPSEAGVFERWAKLKEKAASQRLKA
jgi:LPS O-antigen subunit length determinant protein (WzzB/FepE family)